ncbi:dihydrolipoyl dehydrogenase [bacterium]|nr:dihydrolipoyl dehydrogenase [bacterium]
MADTFDLVVIGAGPGGYVAAIRAAQLGMNVACVEKDATLGGTCLNVGCIPSKALLESSELYHKTKKEFAAHGIEADTRLDLPRMMKRKEAIVGQLTKGVEGLFKKNKIERVSGAAQFVDARTVRAGDRTLTAKNIIVATGSVPASLPGITIDGINIVDSTGALAFGEAPRRLVVIGAGYIGLECASIWSRLGSEVTILEYLPRILPGMDSETAAQAQRIFKRQGLAIETGVRVAGAITDAAGVRVSAGGGEGETRTWEADKLLVAVGRKPNTEGLALDAAGVATDDKGRIAVNERCETNVAGIFAIGDAVRGPMLAHKASEEGVMVVERINGVAGHVNYSAIPGVVYTNPEIATVGRTEDDLKDAGIEYKKGSFPFAANGRAKALESKEGFVKILADAKTDRILGAHIIGPRAGDLIHELVLAMEFGASGEDVARTCHAHPTLAEVVKEAALALGDGPIHI